MKVALVHDWLNGMRGGERALEVLCELYPQAEIFTLLAEPKKVSETIRSHTLHTSFIQRLPGARKFYRHYLPLFPAAIEQFDLRGFDLVISSSHCVAKGVLTPPGVPHLCYCFTPMRYAWEQYHEYFPAERLGWFSKRVIPFLMSRLRLWDAATANRVDAFMAISRHVARRINKYYRREAEVVYPPVESGRFAIAPALEPYYLVVSALVPYKRIDRAVLACNQLGVPLVVVGDGPEQARLKRLAGPQVRFVSGATDQQLTEYYSRCQALLFPGEEDFGITPLEAMASGRPVVALGKGGVTETVVDGETGVFFHQATPGSLAEAIQLARQVKWDPERIRRRALEFDRPRFKARLAEAIQRLLAEVRQKDQ